MNPGPELDRAIAERALGLHMAWEDRFGSCWVNDNQTQCRLIGKPGEWSPSTNITHAWEVVEKLGLMVFPNKGGWAAAKASYDTAGEGPQHGEHWIDDSLDYYATADTAPHAICLAALAATDKK